MDSLRIFIRDIKNYRLPLDYDENADIAAAQHGDTEARNRVVVKNLKLVISIAFANQNTKITRKDAIQEGCFGLLRAIEDYSPEKKCKFGTYATYWIKQKITRAIENNGRVIRVPSYITDNIRKYNKATAELSKNLNRPPLDREIAEAMSMKLSDIKKIKENLGEVVSLESPIEGDEKATLADFVEDSYNTDPYEKVAKEDSSNAIMRVLDTLKPQEKEVILYYYGLEGRKPLTLAKIGEKMNLSRARIEQIKNSALKKMRSPNRKKIFEEELYLN